jgi:hypothetical protein
MASGETRYAHDVLRVPAVHKDGRALSIAFTVGLLYGPQREVTGIVAVIRDETARFAEERNLRKRLAELEGTMASQPSPGRLASKALVSGLPRVDLEWSPER